MQENSFFGVSDQVPHKLDCTTTDRGLIKEVKGLYYVEKKGVDHKINVQRNGQCFRIFEIKFFVCFVVNMSGLVHAVEVIHALC